MRTHIVLAFAIGLVLGLATLAAATPLYDDVPDDHPHSDSIEWASGVRIMQGYGDGTFGPNDGVTRGQIATMFHQQNAHMGPVYSMTPVCGTTEMAVIDHNLRGSTAATVEYSVDGGDRIRIDDVIPDDGSELVFDAEEEGIVSIFVDGIAWQHAPTAQDCTPPE